MGNNEARAHHYVPQCWLAGFTDTGENDGMLYVTDLKRKDQWRCKPSGAGHRRDFYRVEDETVKDPLVIEKIFSGIESKIAPVFRTLTLERRGPKDEFELSILIEYMSIQWIRIPRFREFVGQMALSHFADEVLSSSEAWSEALQRAGIPEGAPGSDYVGAKEAWDSGEIFFSRDLIFYLKRGAEAMPDIDASLKRRKWHWIVSEPGEFIGSDSPITMDGPKGQTVGFSNADVLFYPVNRYLMLYGTQEAIEAPHVCTKLVARHNTFAMLTAHEQVYSHRPDFHWVGKENKCLNDWRLFSPEDF